MGYYSTFDTKVTRSDGRDGNEDIDQILEMLKVVDSSLDPEVYSEKYITKIKEVKAKMLKLKLSRDEIESIIHSLNTSEAKWYSYREDMINFSRLFPDLTFEVTRAGEDSSDRYRYWFRDGKVQGGKGMIVYPTITDKWYSLSQLEKVENGHD